MNTTLFDHHQDELDEPSLTYAGSSGWSGTDTSQQRATHEDATGVTHAIQSVIVRRIRSAGETGCTVAELREELQSIAHHGQVSSALTNLHRSGNLCRLSERRDRCKVYVDPTFVNGRTIEEPTSNRVKLRNCPSCGHDLTIES